MKISVIVPAYNEQDNISEVCRRIESLLDVPHELIVVNDHSSDATRDIISGLSRDYPDIKLIDNTQEPGFANAVMTGFRSASGEIVVPVMADLCDDLNTIKKMLDMIDRGFDVVCGSRYMTGGLRLGGSRFKAFLSSLGGRSIHYLLGIPTSDIPNSFKMYRKKVIDEIRVSSTGFELSMEIPLKAYFLGYKITEVPTVWRERTKGKSSFKVFKLLPKYLKLYFWAINKKICLCFR